MSDNRLYKLNILNKSLKPPKRLAGVFLPTERFGKPFNHFDFMLIAERPSMNMPRNWDGKSNYNFNVTERDKFLQETMIIHGVAGRYATDIVKKRDKPRRPGKKEIEGWTSFLLKEIKIIQPKAIIVLGRRTYEKSFEPFVRPRILKEIEKEIEIEWVFHYSSQVPREKFECRFDEVIKKLKSKGIIDNN